MKNILFLSICLLAMVMGNPYETNHSSTHHTFLVKTDLTKEQVENLLNEYHRNHTVNNQETEELLQNEKTELKVKKEKKQKKTHNENGQKNTTETPKQNHAEKGKIENKPPEKPVQKGQPEAKEQPETPEPPEAPEAPEQPETPEVEKTNLKKKQKDRKRIHQNEVKEINEAQEVEGHEVEPEAEIIDNSTCINETKNLLAHNEVKQAKGSFISGFFSITFISFVFISLFLFATLPKKRVKISQSFNELTDYLLVKENQERKYSLKEF